MKKNILLALLLLKCSFAMATPNQAITIDHILPTELEANIYKNNTLTIIGDGFFPHARFQDFNDGGSNDVQHVLQIQYRQISPVIGPVQVASMGRTSPLAIVRLGPGKIQVLANAIARPGNENTVWSFQVCAANVGCSNAANIKVTGPGANSVTVISGSNPIDVAAGSLNQTVILEPRGLRGNVPALRLGATAVFGDFDGRFARFVLPQSMTNTPGLINAFVEDPMTGSDSESFLIRIFGKPQPVISEPLTIVEALALKEPIKDAKLIVRFNQMTFPSSVVFSEGGKNTTITIPLDLLTNKAQITIPASALRFGKYTANLIFSNIAGQSAMVPVAVDISNGTVQPIPRPIPIPEPPRPRFP